MSPVSPGSMPLRAAKVLALGLAVVLAGMAAPAVHAGVFSVVPVRIYMTPRDRAVAITVTNEGDTDMVLQAEINTWRQKPDGTDEQVASDDLVLSPPIIKLAPRARQVVRLARIAPPDLGQQLTYRLILREVPEAAPQKPGIQVAVALAISMPVFITPPNAKAAVQCEAARGAAAAIQVSCVNSGNAYAQLREVQLRKGPQVMGKLDGGFYVLPGARKTIAVPVQQPLDPGATQLTVTFDDGKSQNFDVVLP